jgi:hypothetical protein
MLFKGSRFQGSKVPKFQDPRPKTQEPRTKTQDPRPKNLQPSTMLNSPALNVVIGLVFIYLLYSLLATVISELLATFLGLRARNLKEAIDWMLNGGKNNGFWPRLWDSLKFMKNPCNTTVSAFYDHPEIRQSGSSGIFKTPSSFKAGSFSKVMLGLLFGDGPVNSKVIEERFKNLEGMTDRKNADVKNDTLFDWETMVYIRNLWYEAGKDVAKFRSLLEGWFDQTMEQATEWYRRKIRVVLLVLGFCMAWLFGADTFDMARNLSVDRDAREKLVSMANAYVENNRIHLDTSKILTVSQVDDFNDKLDSLLSIKMQVENDMASAGKILGIGGWLPDTVSVTTASGTGEKTYSPLIDPAALSKPDKNISSGKLAFSCGEKTAYLFRLFYYHFFGFLITAIAISLGAPFWFDLLNKLMHLRTSARIETGSGSKTATTGAQPSAESNIIPSAEES